MIRKLGASLRAILAGPLQDCPYCGTPLEASIVHDYDEESRTWHCRAILDPRDRSTYA